MSIRDNYKKILDEIEIHADIYGNKAEDISLVAVSKRFDMDKIDEALEAGAKILGENKVKEIEEKYPHIDKRAELHMIGNLQTNKVKKLIGKVDLIQSLDRISLLNELEKQGEKNNYTFDVLIQLNISREESKTGILEEDLDDFINLVEKSKNIKVWGFMTMAPFAEDPEEIRWVFKKTRKLFDKYSKIMYNNINMKYLSMGMSNDYKIALEEGANMIRVGSAIFGERKY